MITSRFKHIIAAAAAAVMLMSSAAPGAEAARFGMSYLYYGQPADYAKYVHAAAGALKVVSPSYFDLNEDGSLLVTDKIDPAFIQEMHARGIKVVPFLSNHWNRDIGIKALERRETLAMQIAEAVTAHSLDGVNVDIENLTEKERDAYTDLVRRIREALPEDKEVSVAVSANPSGAATGWAGSYDYAKLSLYSDYLMLMAYDESYNGDETPGPVASIGFVEKSIQYALKYASPDQIVLGVPFYGRYWKTDGTINGYGIPNKDVNALVQLYGGTTLYDEETQTAVSTVTIREGQALPVVNFLTLTPGTYVIWHENETSMKRKLALVEQYGLKGAGSWSLGQESPDTWNYFALWLNGAYFEDAEGHWAKNEIASAAYNGWMNGSAPGRFEPEAPLTRAQAAAVLIRALQSGSAAPASDGAPAMNSPQTAAADGSEASPSGFADVPAGHWANREIAAAKAAGIIDGVGGGLFAPDRSVTREEMAAMLARALAIGAPASSKVYFKDVDPDSWSYPYIAALTEMEVMEGYGEGLFRPQQSITRAEMAALMHRLSQTMLEPSSSQH